MKINDIKAQLRTYVMMSARRTTINNMFAAAIAQYEQFDQAKVKQAIQDLGQDPDSDLICVYCDKPAETWDHVRSLVKKEHYSGYGHSLGNLLPCCKACNSGKSGKDWTNYLAKTIPDLNAHSLDSRRLITRFFIDFAPQSA